MRPAGNRAFHRLTQQPGSTTSFWDSAAKIPSHGLRNASCRTGPLLVGRVARNDDAPDTRHRLGCASPVFLGATLSYRGLGAAASEKTADRRRAGPGLSGPRARIANQKGLDLQSHKLELNPALFSCPPPPPPPDSVLLHPLSLLGPRRVLISPCPPCAGRVPFLWSTG